MKIEFDGIAKIPVDDEKVIGVWTDGVGAFSDLNDDYEEFYFIEGERYKVTIERIDS